MYNFQKVIHFFDFESYATICYDSINHNILYILYFMKKFLSAVQIAKLENVNRMTASRWIKKGLFPNARKVGKSYRIPLEDYYKWRESTKVSNMIEKRTNVQTFKNN